MDIDAQISNLESKSTNLMSFATLNSNTLFMRIGVSILVSLILIYSLRPFFLLSLYNDPKDKQCKSKIKIKPFLLSVVTLSAMLYYTLLHCNVL